MWHEYENMAKPMRGERQEQIDAEGKPQDDVAVANGRLDVANRRLNAQARWNRLRNLFPCAPDLKGLEREYYRELLPQEDTLLYYTRPEKNRFKLCQNDHGLFCSTGGSVVNTDGSAFGIHDLRINHELVVLDQSDNLFVFKPYDNVLQKVVHHSSVVDGQAVKFAGTIKIEDGIITEITNNSGHYKPKTKHLLNFLLFLKERYNCDLAGINLYISGSKGEVRYYSRGPFSAEKYYQQKGFQFIPDAETRSEKFLFLSEQSTHRDDGDSLYLLYRSLQLGNMDALCTIVGRLLQTSRTARTNRIKVLEYMSLIMCPTSRYIERFNPTPSFSYGSLTSIFCHTLTAEERAEIESGTHYRNELMQQV